MHLQVQLMEDGLSSDPSEWQEGSQLQLMSVNALHTGSFACPDRREQTNEKGFRTHAMQAITP